MFVLQGPVVEVDRLQGTSAAGNNYDFWQVFVLVGRSVFSCSVGDDFGPLPKKDDVITAEVRVGTFTDKRGNARLDVQLLRRVEAHIKDARPPMAAAN
uniref:hypothetical protein n=1 Tax=Ornithinimicrobium sufpigmenti TaxID=2508882 RepID=UPI0037C9595B